MAEQPRKISIDGVTSSSICDALARVHSHSAHVLDLMSPSGDVLFGRCATIRFFPNRHDHHSVEDRFDQLLAEVADTGNVLVIASGGYPDQAVAGGKKVARIEAAGFTGLLTDARLRDLEEVAEFDIVTYCSGETVRAAGDDSTPLEANVPVEIDGVGVLPGDWIFADNAGAVVIPDEDLEAVLEAARQIEQRDAAEVARIRGGAGAAKGRKRR
jgi:regulator of RNase E activity RraA